MLYSYSHNSWIVKIVAFLLALRNFVWCLPIAYETNSLSTANYLPGNLVSFFGENLLDSLTKAMSRIHLSGFAELYILVIRFEVESRGRRLVLLLLRWRKNQLFWYMICMLLVLNVIFVHIVEYISPLITSLSKKIVHTYL